MNINEQELAEAIEAVNEGGSALGVSFGDVMERVMTDKEFMHELLDMVYEGSFYAHQKLCDAFDVSAAIMLKEALRTHLEQKAGLM